VKQGRQQQWGWFVGTLVPALLISPIIGDIVLLIYLIVVPEQTQYPVMDYTPIYDPVPIYQPMPGYQPVHREHPMQGYQSMPEYSPTQLDSPGQAEQSIVEYQQIRERPLQE